MDHRFAACTNPGTVKTIHNTVCAECAQHLPGEYLSSHQLTAGDWHLHPNLDLDDSLNYPLVVSNHLNPHCGTQIAVLCAGIADGELEANGRVLALAKRMLSLVERIATSQDAAYFPAARSTAREIVRKMWGSL